MQLQLCHRIRQWSVPSAERRLEVAFVIACSVIIFVIVVGGYFVFRLVVLMGNADEILDEVDEQAWAERGERHAE
jgi:hypothetical protein